MANSPSSRRWHRLGVELTADQCCRQPTEIERAVVGLRWLLEWRTDCDIGRNGRLIADLIVPLAARHRLPAVYPFRYFVTDGGLISYGPDTIDQFRRAAGYVDRILKGEKPADLPVQAPTKYELIDQPQDRQGARTRNAADAARPRRRGDRVRRREFMALIGGTAVAAWPLAARAQQPAMPVSVFSARGRPTRARICVAAFRRGLAENGYVEGQNVTVEYRWALGQYDRLLALAAELVAPTGGRARCGRAPNLRRSQPRLQPRRFRSSSQSPSIRLNSASSPASTGRAATSPG